MRTLYTAFKGIHNSSCQFVSTLPGSNTYLTNSFPGLRRDIETIHMNYDRVIMFGLDKRLKNSVRIELCAEKDGLRSYTKSEIGSLYAALVDAGIPASVSEAPTHYFCNEAYFCMLQKNPNTVFIHIPPARWFSDELKQKLCCVVQNL